MALMDINNHNVSPAIRGHGNSRTTVFAGTSCYRCDRQLQCLQQSYISDGRIIDLVDFWKFKTMSDFMDSIYTV